MPLLPSIQAVRDNNGMIPHLYIVEVITAHMRAPVIKISYEYQFRMEAYNKNVMTLDPAANLSWAQRMVDD